MSKLEKIFQSKLIQELKSLYPGALVFASDYLVQGFPDVLIFYNDKWAVLECKRKPDSIKQPNQAYYVDRMNNMSFARFIFPENKEEVLNELQHTFES